MLCYKSDVQGVAGDKFSMLLNTTFTPQDWLEEQLQKLEQELSISSENSDLEKKVAEMRDKDNKLKEAEAHYDSVKQCFQ